MRFTRYFLLCALTIFLGCGYGLEGRKSGLPDDIRLLAIPHAENSSTKMRLGGLVTDEVRRQFTTSKIMRLVETEKADAVLQLKIRSVKVAGATLSNINRTSSRRITITLDSFLRRQDTGALLWRGVGFVSFETFVVEADHVLTEQNEELALAKIVRELAVKVHNHMFLGF